MKSRNSTLFIAILMVLGTTLSAAPATRVDIELIDDYEYSFEIAPTDEVIAFLEEYGIDMNLDAKRLGKAIGGLDQILVEDDATGDITSIGDELDTVVIGALLAAIKDSEYPFFMDLGTLRWVIQR